MANLMKTLVAALKITLDEAKKLHEEIRKQDNESCSVYHKSKKTLADHLARTRDSHFYEGEFAALREVMIESGLEAHIMDTTVTFQARDDESNYELGRRLVKKFGGTDDSEGGQGFYYTNHDTAQAVVAWLNDGNAEPKSVRTSPTHGLIIK
jgi:hypothetical protein